MRVSLLFGLLMTASVAYGHDYTHKKCESSEGGRVVLPIDLSSKKIVEECMPEVLYSWASIQKIEGLLSRMTPDNILPFGQTFWTWRTPIGTFGYGDFAIRVKLKKGVKVFWNKKWDESGGCKYLSEEEKRTTIVFGYYGGKNYSEYVLCSDAVIDSWSYGTPEIQLEMIKEYEWVENHKNDPTNYDRFYKTMTSKWFTDTDYSSTNYFNFKIDGKNWTKEALQKKFENIENLVNSENPGKVFYQRKVKPSRIEHYRVRYPDYFNL